MSTMPIVSIDNAELRASLQAAIDQKTKPLDSLGRLEALALQVGLVQQTTKPELREPTILIFAGDHGVVAEGVSAYPQDVTWQMVENFLAGGAAINVFARQNGLALQIIDAGVNHHFPVRPNLIDRKIAPGTQNFTQQPAMTGEQCELAMQRGRALAHDSRGNVLGFGEMGIGNTTAAAALMHKLTNVALSDCVGAGTGLSVLGMQHKQAVIARAVDLHTDAQSAFDVLACFGGFEIAMMVGAMLGAAEQRKLILVDGFIVTSALLVAARMQPAILDYCVFSHQSHENGHARLLLALGAAPLLHFDLRLGEGTGAALAYPMLAAAVNFLNQMATFASAEVSHKSLD